MRKNLFTFVLPAIVFGLLLVWLRFWLIEPAEMRALCDSASTALCSFRQAVIELFVHQRIGWASLIFAALSVLLGNRVIAAIGLALAIGALVLYVPELGAVAFVTCLLVIVRGSNDGQQLSAAATARNANPID